MLVARERIVGIMWLAIMGRVDLEPARVRVEMRGWAIESKWEGAVKKESWSWDVIVRRRERVLRSSDKDCFEVLSPDVLSLRMDEIGLRR